ncbi:MAG TPA: NADP-dependent phosphogluconate dehydrogenase, partial [Bdellovibrionota bacterium]|nr:NADP-dependent phosphogluconate dehydrogenase [Bdellovibrionota bacterium]
ALEPPRLIFLYVPAGPVVDQVIESLVPLLSRGDVLVDAGNSHFRDSRARQEMLARNGIGFVDCGSSGGPVGARTGGCFMVGGAHDDVRKVEPVLRLLAVPEGYLHAGPPGAGHFVKLIHNAIEFGMLQAIGEGVALLKASQEYSIDLPSLFHNWSHGSVIRGWLIELMEAGLRENPDLARIPPYVEDTGEVNWAVEEALRLEVPVPVIASSIHQLFASRDAAQVAHRAVAILRHGFGGHPFGPNAAIARERHTGKKSA